MQLEVVSGNWEKKEGGYSHKGNKNLFPDSLLIGKEEMRDGIINFEATFENTTENIILHSACVVFRYQDPSHYYFAGIGGYEKKFVIGKKVDNISYLLAYYGDGSEILQNEKYHLEIKYKGKICTLYVNGDMGKVKVLETILHDEGMLYANGNYGLMAFGNETRAILDIKNVKPIKSECFLITPLPEGENLNEEQKWIVEVNKLVRRIGSKVDLNLIDSSDIFDNKPIINDIVSSISNATLVIANITQVNPNVWYELGVAHTLNAETIIICSGKSKKTRYKGRYPFDISHIRILEYSNIDTKDGRKDLGKKLKETIETILGRKQTGSAPLVSI